jgi:HK97 family phage prohead protease
MPQTPIVRGPSETPRFVKNIPVAGLQFKFDEETGEVEGFAAVTGNVDSYEEIIDAGAFKRTLGEKGDRISLAWQHNFREPIGKPSALREVKRDKLPESIRKEYPEATGGLYFKATISDTRQGKDAKILLKDGVVDELSIGYDFYWTGNWEDGWETDSYYEGEDGYVHLREIDLYEFSLVTMAANPAAQVMGYKSVAEARKGSWDETITWTGDHTSLDPDPDPMEAVDQKHTTIIRLIEDGELREAMKRLQELIAWLEPEDPVDQPPAVLGLAEEQELRAKARELETL